MTIEQAIIYIIQNADDEQKQWASDVILGKKNITTHHDATAHQAYDFYFPTFSMGGLELPTREQIYDERAEQILGLNNE